jgi:hypothetical protein
MGWAWQTWNGYSLGEKPVGRPRSRRENNTEKDFRKTGQKLDGSGSGLCPMAGFVISTFGLYYHYLRPQNSTRFCCIRQYIQKFPDWVIMKYTLPSGITRWEATQMVIAAKLTRLTHKIVIQLRLVAESCIICIPCSRRPVRKLLGTPSYS